MFSSAVDSIVVRSGWIASDQTLLNSSHNAKSSLDRLLQMLKAEGNIRERVIDIKRRRCAYPPAVFLLWRVD
jgi:hypothetical protein